MSSIAGILNLKPENIDPIRIKKMLEVVKHRGSDSVLIEQDPGQPLAIGQALLNTTPDTEYRKIKYHINNQAYFLVFDGRIDDREILIEQLNLPSPENITDSELIVQSYVRWGELFLEKIEGDFAFGLWDAGNQTLILARDRSGMCTLFYYTDDQRIIWGSEIKQIFQNRSISRKLNEAYLLRYLVDYPSSLEDTVYSKIKRIEPGHYVILQDGKISVKRYYSFKPTKLSYRSEIEYIEHFHTLFQHVIKNITRGTGTIGFTLSGGLDSSSIVSMAAQLTEKGEMHEKEMKCYSLVFNDFAEADEREYISSVQEKYPFLTYELVSGDQHWNFNEGTFEFLSDLDEPFYLFNQSLSREIPKRMQKENIRIHIGGHTGDHVLMGNENYLALMLKKLNLLQLVKEIRALKNNGYLFREILISHMLLPILNRKNKHAFPPWVHEEKLTKHSSTNLLSDLLKPSKYFTWDEEDVIDYFNFIVRTSGHEWSNQYVEGRHAIEMRYPFLNRNLMEFLAGIPVNLKWKPNETKYILRQAMNGILPEKIAKRKGKTRHDSFIYGGLRKEWKKIQQFYTCPILSELGLVDKELVQQRFDQYYVGMKSRAQDFVGLLRVLSLEIWLQKYYSKI